MRRLETAIGVAAAVLFAASAALFFLKHPLRQTKSDEVALGVQDIEKRISPRQLLVKSTGENGTTTAVPLKPDPETQSVSIRALYTDWRPGATQVLDSRAVTEEADYIRPQWSPIGLDIACTRKDQSGIYIAGDSGTQATMLTEDSFAGAYFRWNMDGMSLNFQDADGGPADLTITGEKYPSSERPRVVFESDNIIYFQPEESEPVQVSGTDDQFVFPELSPDHESVLFLGLQTGIYIASIDDHTVVCVGKGENPQWLPDSSGIVYDIPVRDSTSVVDGDLWFASADGRERTNMTKTAGITESNPAVAPDGERIAFSSRGAIFVGKFQRPNPDAAAAQ